MSKRSDTWRRSAFRVYQTPKAVYGDGNEEAELLGLLEGQELFYVVQERRECTCDACRWSVN